METVKNVISNSFSKTYLKNDADISKFNTFMYIGALAIMPVMLLRQGWKLSLYTVMMGVSVCTGFKWDAEHSPESIEARSACLC